MAFSKITVSNGVEIKTAPLGFSWTVFFFGGWPAIFRQDWLWGVLLIIASVLTYGIAGIVCAFFYNKVYLKNLLNKGYHIHALPPGVTEDHVKTYLGLLSLPNPTPKV